MSKYDRQFWDPDHKCWQCGNKKTYINRRPLRVQKAVYGLIEIELTEYCCDKCGSCWAVDGDTVFSHGNYLYHCTNSTRTKRKEPLPVDLVPVKVRG